MGRILNDELLRKAIITAADALASYGKLNAQQSNRFIDYVFDSTAMKEHARLVRFTPETLNIDKIGVGTRVALPKAEAVAPSYRRGVTTSQVTLTPKEICVPFEVGDVFSEINIEEADVEDHVVRMMATQLGNDIEELALQGDTLGHPISELVYTGAGSATDMIKDNYLALADGWLKLARLGNPYDALGANIGGSVFSGMIKAMPEKFRRRLGDLRFFISPDLAQNWREKISTRATGGGDDALHSAKLPPVYGVTLAPIPLLQFTPRVVQHDTLTGDGGTIDLDYFPLVADSTIVTKSSLGAVPTTPYIEDTDYSVVHATGVLTDLNVGITHTDELKIGYQAGPQIILTHKTNYIIGLGREIRIEKDRDIFKGVNQYAITCKIAVEFEELTAIVHGVNIGTGV